MDQPPRATVDQRQRRRDQRMVRCSETDFLRKGEPQHHPRLAVVREPLSSRAIDESIEIRQPPKRLPGNCKRKPVISR